MLCNPHNPGGTVFNQEEIEWINILAKKNNLIVCSDEIHADLILDKGLRHFPIGKDISANQATVGLMSLNKSYNFPGIGLGWAVIANPTLRAKFSKGLHTLIPGPNLLAFEATLAAIKGGQIWHKELIDYLRKNRDLVEEWVQQYPSLKMVHLPAT
jgi:bifunctional pyridoxal-dependent enzyme with beta-cystathionase and maltose regulon repressor activities